ncbi:hypothetical protein LC613_33445 [Nostoc sphaeroides CHAB 2801]|uniref:hypothetical protein n=1 Tax=Nostoc sphaeroides TaxID=446679 RepID=UPI001E3A84DA|nr:hypothetical protein [Nostoc sphaeroides]MCC5632520.1 hypothetical protein [Nostoc sphaeroides CHAB 2801]
MIYLLKKLESQKTKLPLEDHSIVDWGINAIRARMEQREQIMDLVRQELENIKKNFIEEWDKTSDPEKIKKLFKNGLEEIMIKSADLEYEKGAKEVIVDWVKYLCEHKPLNKNSFKDILKTTSDYCREYAKNLTKKKYSEQKDKERANSLSEKFKLAAEDITENTSKLK